MSMEPINISIDFRYIKSHNELVIALARTVVAKPFQEVHFSINLNTYSTLLYSDYLLLIISVVKRLRALNVTVKGNFINFKKDSNLVKYASRVNFFKLIEFDYKEEFERHPSGEKFTEILEFNEKNSYQIYADVMGILIKDEINEEMLKLLYYCIWEVIDNSLRHSNSDGSLSNGTGFISCQYFPKNKQIRLIIADNGQGIHRALTSHPNSKYQHLSEKEAVEQSIVRGVTNSTGRGFGLWATSTLVKENGGTLIIQSDNHQLKQESELEVIQTEKWQGTLTFLSINTNVPVDYNLLFDTDTQSDSYDEFKEKLFGNIDDLW